MNIGSAIKSIRKELHITQDSLALKCSLSQTSLSQIENGLKRPTAKTMKKLSTAMDIPEVVIYIMAMEEGDVSENKKGMYHLVYASIKRLALQIASKQNNYQSPESFSQVFDTKFITSLSSSYARGMAS